MRKKGMDTLFERHFPGLKALPNALLGELCQISDNFKYRTLLLLFKIS